MDIDAALSRPAAASGRLGEAAEDRHRFWKKSILLTGETATLSTPNGRVCLDAGLRLLVRMCPNVTVALPQECGSLREACEAVARRIAFGQPVQCVDGATPFSGFDAILSVGSRARPDLPWTAVNSNGWLARVSSGVTDLATECRQSNPVGAVLAASLGAADLYKRLIRLKPERGELTEDLTFSALTYKGGGQDPGPCLPGQLKLEGLLVGAGAIGNGILYLVGALPFVGWLWVVDKDIYKRENLGTCLLIGPGDIGTPKAFYAERYITAGLRVEGFSEELAVFKNKLGRSKPYPRVVMGAVDCIDARHEIQDLWPDAIIDGAIGDFAAQVSRHPWGEDLACLRCLFREPAGTRAELVQPASVR